jgi:hypothetical protein
MCFFIDEPASHIDYRPKKAAVILIPNVALCQASRVLPHSSCGSEIGQAPRGTVRSPRIEQII